jgi:serine/threonine protein phosphatase PrpC
MVGIVVIVCISLLYWLLADSPLESLRFLQQALQQPGNGYDLIHLQPLTGLILLLSIILIAWIFLIFVAMRMDPQPFQTWPCRTNQLSKALPVTQQWSNNFHATPPYQLSRAREQPNNILPDTTSQWEDDEDEITQRLEKVSKERSSAVSHVGSPKSKERVPGLVSDRSDHPHVPAAGKTRDEAIFDGVRSGEEARLLVGVSQDPGIVRRNAPNEDTLFAFQGTRVTENGSQLIGFFVVADGMGGHSHGQEASHAAMEAMSDSVLLGIMRDGSSDDYFLELLKKGVYRANQILYQRNCLQRLSMGTTLTAALVVGKKAYIANVGDSRTYIYRKGAQLLPITRDHSLVARLVEVGLITQDQIYTHPKRNQIYRSLGNQASVEVDTFVEELQYGDVLLLCSDGLWEMVRDSNIQSIVTSVDHPMQISHTLVQTALDHGGEDNVSVVVVCLACVKFAC